MSQVLVAREKEVTLKEVNEKLLKRLNELIDDAGAEDILQITESIAKLNSSYKGNTQFGEPLSEEERLEKEQKDLLGNILTGEEV